MSLDVYLTLEKTSKKPSLPRIFIRENGQNREITRAEWDERFPGREPVTVEPGSADSHEVYHANITHNLNNMADAAGLYKYLWRPDKIGITKAAQLIEPLRAGLTTLKSDPERFRQLNPPNGWGDYEGLVAFVTKYLAACEENPTAEVSVWR